MTTTSVLDADMTTVAGWLRSGFAWWIDELRGLVPPALGQRFGARPAVVASFHDGRFSYARKGAAIERGNGTLAVAIALPETTALVRDVRLPALGQADLRRLIAFEAERLLPFPPGTAAVDFEAVATGDGVQKVALAGLPLPPAQAALAAAEAEGLDVRRLGIAAADGVRFDFLPALRAASLERQKRHQLIWWGIAGLALLLLLAALIVRDIYQLRETEALVEAHGQAAQSARLLKARIVAEDARRRTLIDRRRLGNPLPVLALTTAALPDSVWVQRLSLEGGQLRLGGFKPANVDVVALLRRTPGFAAVRNSAVDVPASAGALQPFEVTAEVLH